MSEHASANRQAQLGVIFPARDIGSERGSILGFAPQVEALEPLSFVVAYDHVTAVRPEQDDAFLDVSRNFDCEDPWHEPLTLFAAMAALTERINLVSGCLILPQRPTALVAQQAAEVDILSDGRLIFGAALGWNKIESAALGCDFSARAPRFERQLQLLRALWNGEEVSGDNQQEHFENVRLQPLPVQRPIPVWLGGLSTKAIARAVRCADGWIPLDYVDVGMVARLQYLRDLTAEAGREPLQVLGRINPWRDSHKKCVDDYKRWLDGGATHIAIGTSKGCFSDNEQYFGDLARFLEHLLAST
jgi:probable F420-dependent oxidoreductase